MRGLRVKACPRTFVASFGVGSVCVGHSAPWVAAPTIWLTWWVGDAIGSIMLTPFLVCRGDEARPPKRWTVAQVARAVVVVATVTIVCAALFFWKIEARCQPDATAPGEDGARVRILVSVTDTGVGVVPDTLGKLFERFSQSDSSTTRKFGGTGLGRAICRQLVDLMRGAIGVESEPGRGSRFWLVVPFRVAAGSPGDQGGERADPAGVDGVGDAGLEVANHFPGESGRDLRVLFFERWIRITTSSSSTARGR